MAKRNDFMEGFLRGLYNSGVGNPEVQRQNEKDQQTQNADFTTKMAGQGMTPNALPPDHPISQKVGSFISQMFGGASSPRLTAANFKADPNAFTMDTTGHLQRGGVGQAGNTVIPQDKAPTLLAEQYRQEQKPTKEWTTITGELSANGTILQTNLAGDIRDSGVKAKANAGSNMAGVRQTQFTIQDLPSNQAPNTSGGAAAQVKIAARMGKSLIAKAGSAQKTALASTDLARAITRSVPTLETIAGADYANNWKTQASSLLQKITAAPSGPDAPKMRKELYNMFEELDKTATPFIENQLNNMRDAGFDVTPETRKRELGQTLPEIPFSEEGAQPQMTDQDQQAIEWAQKNPLDPRAQKIKALHGIRS